MLPDTLHDDVFGELYYDWPMKEWYAEVALAPKHQIEVAISWDEATDGPFAPILERARWTYTCFQHHEPKHRQALAASLVRRYWGWKRDDEEAPDAKEITEGLSVLEISIAADGSAIVRYEDAADLFGDHCIFAELSEYGHFLGFTLQG
jgi:hypothetical protein